DVARRRVISPPLKARLGGVSDICFSPDGKSLAVAYTRDAVAIWDVDSLRTKGNLFNLEGAPMCVAFSPDGRWLAIGSGYGKNKALTLTDRANGNTRNLPMDAEETQLNKLAFSPNGKILAAGRSDGKIMLWDMKGFHELRGPALLSGAGTIYGLCFDPGSRLLAIGTQNKGLYTWEIDRPDPSAHFDTKRSIMDLAFIDEDNIAAVLYDSTVTVLSTQGLRPQPVLKDLVNDVMTCISLTADNRTVVLGRDRGDIWFREETSDHRISSRMLPVRLDHGIKDLAIIAGSNILAVAVKDSTIRFLDVRTGREKHPPIRMDDDISFITLSHNERIVAVGMNSGSIILLDAGTFQPLGNSLEGHAKVINFLRFSPDDRYLASASYDRMVYIWDVATLKPSGLPLLAHQGQVLTLAFSADGRMLASGGADNYINLWDVGKHARFASAFQANAPVKKLAFSADGKYLYSAGDDRQIFRWTLNPQDWLTAAADIANN
ncbi:MAG TPA: WD40 repeat domain-containing protein, partial [Puia sp.]|nr:WD40 repeat domain-containing protein [Puia sp.]